MKPHGFVLALVLAGTLMPARAEGGASHAVLGKQLFEGTRALEARIGGHAAPLPGVASRCVNCHVDAPARPASGPLQDTQQFGPALTRDLLVQSQKRRGGPASKYEAGSFCQLLRTGVDPAHIVLPRAMPIYTITDSDCLSLWTYLTQPAAAR